MPSRTRSDIVARIARLRAGGTDLFGFGEEVLLAALDYAYARQFLTTGVAASDWDQQVNHEAYAMAYLGFAIGKILDHCGNSASRSVDKLAELAWLACRDDVVAAMQTAGYPMYGATDAQRDETIDASREAFDTAVLERVTQLCHLAASPTGTDVFHLHPDRVRIGSVGGVLRRLGLGRRRRRRRPDRARVRRHRDRPVFPDYEDHRCNACWAAGEFLEVANGGLGRRYAVTRRPESHRSGGTRLYRPETDDYLVETLQGLDPWRPLGRASTGMSL